MVWCFYHLDFSFFLLVNEMCSRQIVLSIKQDNKTLMILERGLIRWYVSQRYDRTSHQIMHNTKTKTF